MTRTVFLKRAMQAGLFALLSLVVFLLKNRIATGENCSSCPDIADCPGKRECNKF
jgi:hypothetical protein